MLIKMFSIYLEELSNFFDRGGVVLYLVFIIAIALWTLLIERYIYIKYVYKKYRNDLLTNANNHNYADKFKEDIQRYMLEDSNLKLKSGVDIIKTLIIVCPLVGLLGTVTGMIEVFDVMSISGTGNVKSMANGVSMATIPTMAGMVVALSGILLEKKLDLSIKYNKEQLNLDIAKALK